LLAFAHAAVAVLVVLPSCSREHEGADPSSVPSALDPTPDPTPDPTANPAPDAEPGASQEAVQDRAAPADTAELPERFAGMVPAHAARPGRAGIGQAQDVFHELLGAHERVTRTVEDLPGGVRTTTTSDDPHVAALIRLHVRQMDARLSAGMPVRRWDPLFAELVARYRSIDMVYQDVPGGITVTQTSEDPQVVLLIRQHAHRAVSEFVARGFDRAGEPTPLPEGYAAPSPAPAPSTPPPPSPAGPG
jgi:hypothetical protein